MAGFEVDARAANCAIRTVRMSTKSFTDSSALRVRWHVMRIEFTVARFDDPGALGVLEGRQVPVSRLVLNARAADLFDRLVNWALAQAGAACDRQPDQRACSQRAARTLVVRRAHRLERLASSSGVVTGSEQVSPTQTKAAVAGDGRDLVLRRMRRRQRVGRRRAQHDAADERQSAAPLARARSASAPVDHDLGAADAAGRAR